MLRHTAPNHQFHCHVHGAPRHWPPRSRALGRCFAAAEMTEADIARTAIHSNSLLIILLYMIILCNIVIYMYYIIINSYYMYVEIM
jgi:hypothetical protein